MIHKQVFWGLLFFTSPATSAQPPTPAWPQYRGPLGTGIGSEPANPPIEFGPEKGVLWRTVLPSGHSSPSIWGTHIFLTGFDKQTSKLEVLALNRNNGKILWRRAIPATAFEEVHSLSSLATATPATDGERVYAYFGSFGIVCYDFEGNLKWSVPLPVANIIPHGSGTSLIVAGDKVILNRDEVPDSYLLAVDRRSGKILWKQKQYMGEPEKRNGGKATPVIWRGSGKEEIILHRRGEIVGYDLATGARSWWVRTETQGAGTPVASHDAIYVGTWFNTGEPGLLVPLPAFDDLLKQYDQDHDGALSRQEFPDKILIAHREGLDGIEGADNSRPSRSIFPVADTNKDGKIERREWEAYERTFAKELTQHGLLAIRPGGTGNVTGTHILWKEPKGVPEVPSPLYFKKRVYAIAGGIVTCLDSETGKLIYRGRLAPGAYFASPVTAGGRIYFASGEGQLTVIASGDKLELLAVNDLGEPIYATPAIIGGVIYVRTASVLTAFGAGN